LPLVPEGNGLGILTQFPFAVGDFDLTSRHSIHTFNEVNLQLRIALLTANHCSCETLLLFGAQNSHLCNCYYHQDLHQRPLHPESLPSLFVTFAPSYFASQNSARDKVDISSRLECHPFSTQLHSAGKLLHTSERLPTSMAIVQLSI